MNVTPKRGARRPSSPSRITPDKAERVHHVVARDAKPIYIAQRNILGWESEGLESADEGILRDFDMDMRYGPCCTISRIARWERAEAFGMQPPRLVKDAIDKTKNMESVLDMHLRQVSTSGSFR